MNVFCDSIIKPLKQSKHKLDDKIIVSTCYFNEVASYFRFSSRNLKYLEGLISNIETFQHY